VIDGFRWALLESSPYPGTAQILISIGSALLILSWTLVYFHRTEQYFADNI
jgi:hypothetical protein